MLLYVFLNIFLGIKEIGLQRLHLRIQYLGNIGIVQLVIVTQVEHQPLFLRKLPDGFLQERQAFPVVIIRTFIRNIGQTLPPHLIQRQQRLSVLLNEAERLVRGYLVKPCRKFAFSLEGIPMPIDAQKRFLQHIFSIVMPRKHPADMPIQWLLIAFNQTSETSFLIHMSDFQNLFIHASSDCLLDRPYAFREVQESAKL